MLIIIILITRLQYVLARRLENVVKTSQRRMTKAGVYVLIKTSWIGLLKTYDPDE